MIQKRIVIAGGGFGGVYTAMELEKRFKKDPSVHVTLISHENFLLFTPMLHEVAASDLDGIDIVNPIHKLLDYTDFFCGTIESIDLEKRVLVVSHGVTSHSHDLPFDYLVIAVGAVTHFFGIPGIAEHALTMKSLGDSLHLRNEMIAHLEEADFECSEESRDKLLTFVVAGSGFAGVETVAAMNDFLKEVVCFYRNLKESDIRVVLVSAGEVVLPELDPKLGRYAGKLLEKRGVEIHYHTKVTSFENHEVTLSDGKVIKACSLIWTAGNAPHPLLAPLNVKKEKGRLLVSQGLQVDGSANVWALGDCAAIPDPTSGGYHPPTAQHAIREARVVAENIYRAITGNEPPVHFRFKTLGQLASLGHRRGVAQVMGLRFSGFIAWWLWRTIYLMKLPRFEKRCRVAANWTLDVLFAKDTVQLPIARSVHLPGRSVMTGGVEHH